MIEINKILQIQFLSIGIILINTFYLIPNFLECLIWKSEVTIGYAAIELIFIYIVLIFFVIAIISLIDGFKINYRVQTLIITMSLFLVSFILAYRVISYIVFIFSLLYAIVFLILFKRARNKKKYNYTNINIVGFILTLIGAIIDFKFLR